MRLERIGNSGNRAVFVLFLTGSHSWQSVLLSDGLRHCCLICLEFAAAAWRRACRLFCMRNITVVIFSAINRQFWCRSPASATDSFECRCQCSCLSIQTESLRCCADEISGSNTTIGRFWTHLHPPPLNQTAVCKKHKFESTNSKYRTAKILL